MISSSKSGLNMLQIKHALPFLYGEIYAISRALAHFIPVNRSIFRKYAHDDVSTGSWFIGLQVKHVDESKFCCSSWSTGSICAAV
ncbi:hypothetical protein BDE02_01G085600 [Populus trichocarpa]|nr:hypothetical protein BDE02_01G085600 [Populus trichocarpa]